METQLTGRLTNAPKDNKKTMQITACSACGCILYNNTYLYAFGGVVEVNRVIPGRERLSEVRVHHVRLAFLEARQTGPVAAALHAKAAGDSRPEAFRPRDFPNEVHLFGLFWSILCMYKVVK